MKKIIVLGFLLLIVLFTHSSKKQLTKQSGTHNNNEATEKQLIINNTDHRLHKFDEPIQTTIEVSDKQHAVKQFSRRRKGKIIYIKNNTKTQTIVFE
ncbi:hypothetical protein ACNQGP_09220 [Flavobacterium sp. GT2N3]|uniref:hypothetical protein n=1 Tax=unclassified Flavobacterium TaxID=196869 RepID=UPI003AAD141C